MTEYLLDVDKHAYDLYDKLLLDFKKKRNITEELKVSN
ncbi:TnpV protein [[Clostridium] innocuum]|nr:TnpV protein [[Clostridium] innocuum]MCR0329643.1 TnpV protein [[Clostridium] innocuum]